jgi:hypothetical protein
MAGEHNFAIFTCIFPGKIAGKNTRDSGKNSPRFRGKIPAIPGKIPRDSGKKSPWFRGEIPAIEIWFVLAAGQIGASAPDLQKKKTFIE